MAEPIDFYFDFASPYAYFLAEPLASLAAAHGRVLNWRPLMLWAVLKEIGLPPPLDNAVKRRYVLADMARSARHVGKPFALPDRFPVSSHLPARLFHELAADDPAGAVRFAHRVFKAYFTEGADLGDAAVIEALALDCGIARERARAGEAGRALVLRAIDQAVAAGVWGSPYVVIGAEAFFGADRLPQIEACLRGDLRP
ncbi:2-hydroxychromene-2-carboxylate isomerase [Zavarzinia compransoris]|uniref:2-hydroxychromene-2-carboxylate isomerase n=1 Tax=Zavarzinia compransoris TaxID=1264899 RepID=A0A317E6B7_9PROT|nr:2-hydroxychromene-2-carboxylate isomerase [Zavarzinia compransoris]PWR22162.1 2-hydroxychromene-2-carboxylate isomerase [Zavarzinia compransoris]TDP47087.1 2-hydroxychromene-2-carboxylate isomerase [Zavarzinia compransoris]